MNSGGTPSLRKFNRLPVTIAALLLLGFLVSVLSPLKAAGSPPSPIVLNKNSSYELSGHIEYYVDHSRKKGLADILQPTVAGSFIPMKNTLSEGYSRDAYWLHFIMTRTELFPERAWLRIYPSYLDHVDMYVQTGTNPDLPSSYQKFSFGDHVPVAQRPLQHPEFVTSVLLAENQPVSIYIRVHSTSTINLAGTIHTQKDLFIHTYKYLILNSVYLSASLLTAIMSTLFFLRFQDKIYLFFSLYVFNIFFASLALSGMINLVWPSNAHILSDYLLGFGTAGGRLCFALFAIDIFKTSRFPWLHRAIIFLIIMSCLTILAIPLDFYSEIAPILIATSLGILLFMIPISFRAVIDRESGAILYFSAFIINSLGYITHFIRSFGWTPLEWWNINAIHMASLFNMALMAIALTERFFKAEQQAVELARGAEQKALTLAGKMTRELHEQERQLELSLASKQLALDQHRQFLSMLSHEYRTPLTVIRGNATIMELREKAERQTRYSDNLEAIQISIDRLVEVMEVSLERTRMSDTGQEKQQTNISFADFLTLQIENARIMWPHYIFNYSHSLNAHHQVIGEPLYLKTAIFNLLDNATKYSPDNSPVTIDCCIKENDVIIRIENQGDLQVTGQREELFEKYRRGENSANTTGAGIGLWLVSQIIKRHNGTVKLESTASCVVATVSLPLAGQAVQCEKS